MVDATLRELDTWFKEPSPSGDRLKLLSKLAILELCGWLEGEFDRLALLADTGRLNDPEWVKKTLISKTYGFQYDTHWRQMFTRLVGEVFVRRVEAEMESNFPGDLARLKSLLGSLWKVRCDFAHADMAAHLAAQQTFQAPSWSIGQYRDLKQLLDRYETAMTTILATI